MNELYDATDDDVARLSGALRAKLAPLTHSHPVPAEGGANFRQARQLPTKDHKSKNIRVQRRGTIVAMVAAGAATVLAISMTVAPDANAAWAANPQPATPQLIDEISVVCADAFSLGALEQSGTAYAGDTDSVGPMATDGPNATRDVPLPVELPELLAIDVRGNGGFAVFSTGDLGAATTSVFCAVEFADEVRVTSLSSEVGASDASSHSLTVGTGTTIADQPGSSTLVGSLVRGATTVEVLLDGLPTAKATVFNDRFAIWWPDMASAIVRQLDAQGVVLSETAVG